MKRTKGKPVLSPEPCRRVEGLVVTKVKNNRNTAFILSYVPFVLLTLQESEIG